MEGTITRRRLLGRGAAALGAAAVLAPEAALAAPKRTAAYRLDPGAGCCTSCNACRSHDARYLFARKQDIRRAHLGCDCGVVEVPLLFGTWVALYGHPAHMRATEARLDDTRTRAILRTKI